MTSIKIQSALNADKEGRRLRALRECFHRALKLALDCPTWEVGNPYSSGRVDSDRNTDHSGTAGVYSLLQGFT